MWGTGSKLGAHPRGLVAFKRLCNNLSGTRIQGVVPYAQYISRVSNNLFDLEVPPYF